MMSDMGAATSGKGRRHPNLWLAVWGLLFFVAATVWTNHLDNHFAWLRSHGVHTTATLTSIHCTLRAGCGDSGSVSFTTATGTQSAKIALNEHTRLRPGDQIPIAYNPRRPSDARSLERNASLPFGELFGVLAYLAALGCWVTPAIRWNAARSRERKLSALRQPSSQAAPTASRRRGSGRP